jgi:hypothetical protein
MHETNIKIDLKETGWGGKDWIHLAQCRDQQNALVIMVMNLWDQCSSSLSIHTCQTLVSHLANSLPLVVLNAIFKFGGFKKFSNYTYVVVLCI